MPPTTQIASVLAAVLGALALFHVAWAAGLRLGANAVVPKVQGRPAFVPSRNYTLVVAALLLAGSLVALTQGHVLPGLLPETLVHWAALAAGTVFLLRAFGELRLVGFFKRVRNTTFARWDTWLFSPLCALIGSSFWYLAFH